MLATPPIGRTFADAQLATHVVCPSALQDFRGRHRTPCEYRGLRRDRRRHRLHGFVSGHPERSAVHRIECSFRVYSPESRMQPASRLPPAGGMQHNTRTTTISVDRDLHYDSAVLASTSAIFLLLQIRPNRLLCLPLPVRRAAVLHSGTVRLPWQSMRRSTRVACTSPQPEMRVRATASSRYDTSVGGFLHVLYI